ncbi:hypothetical protein [Tateyamaria sp.]|uniref:hypothetical protein n=1 Tax=Tateyamaria sp. TaxID=1929288 RepID=UPI00329DED82
MGIDDKFPLTKISASPSNTENVFGSGRTSDSMAGSQFGGIKTLAAEIAFD